MAQIQAEKTEGSTAIVLDLPVLKELADVIPSAVEKERWVPLRLERRRLTPAGAFALDESKAKANDFIAATQVGDLTFLVTEQGKPFTANGFGNWFRDVCDHAGLPQFASHGLR